MICNHLVNFLGCGDLILCHRSMYKISAATLLKDTFKCRAQQVTVFCALFSLPLLGSLNVALTGLCTFQGKIIII